MSDLWSDETEARPLRSSWPSVRRWSHHAISPSSSATPAARPPARFPGRRRPASRTIRTAGRRDAPSALPYADGHNPPIALDRGGLARVRAAFAAGRPALPPASASTPSSSTARTAICCTSSSRRSPTRRDGRVWRLPGEPHALPSGGVRCRPRGLPGRSPRDHARFGHRLGGRWLGYRVDRSPSPRLLRPAAAAPSTSPVRRPDRRPAASPRGRSYQVPLARAGEGER